MKRRRVSSSLITDLHSIRMYLMTNDNSSGWSGGAMVLSKLPVVGRSTNLD